MGRRAAKITQDELARVLRAAEQLSTPWVLEIENGRMRLSPQPVEPTKPKKPQVARNANFRF